MKLPRHLENIWESFLIPAEHPIIMLFFVQLVFQLSFCRFSNRDLDSHVIPHFSTITSQAGNIHPSHFQHILFFSFLWHANCPIYRQNSNPKQNRYEKIFSTDGHSSNNRQHSTLRVESRQYHITKHKRKLWQRNNRQHSTPKYSCKGRTNSSYRHVLRYPPAKWHVEHRRTG